MVAGLNETLPVDVIAVMIRTTLKNKGKWCTRLDSNQWPSPSEGDALSS